MIAFLFLPFFSHLTHHGISKYYQCTSRACAQVPQNLIVLTWQPLQPGIFLLYIHSRKPTANLQFIYLFIYLPASSWASATLWPVPFQRSVVCKSCTCSEALQAASSLDSSLPPLFPRVGFQQLLPNSVGKIHNEGPDKGPLVLANGMPPVPGIHGFQQACCVGSLFSEDLHLAT